MKLAENYTLERKSIKHARIKIREDLSIRVTVPVDFSDKEITALLTKKHHWIKKHLNYFNRKKGQINLHANQLLLLGSRYSYFYTPHLHHKVVLNHEHKTVQSKVDLLDHREQIKWYKKFARLFITQKVEILSKQHKCNYNKIFIRDQKTKWGSCSADKNLSFNWRLIKTPEFVVDYIILHELLHTKVMNHTKKFWSLLKLHCPEYKSAIQWLDKYGSSL